MKRILCLLLAQSLLGSAETLYLDNDPTHPADHRTLLAAHEAVEDGDVIIIAPSATTYPGITITKKLTIKGNGFGGDAPPNALGSPIVATVGAISIGASNVDDAESAEGTVLEGLVLSAGISIYSQSCLVKRCALLSTSTIYAAGFSMEGCRHDGQLTFSTRIIGTVTSRATSYNVRNSIIRSSTSAATGTSGAYNYCVFRASPLSPSSHLRQLKRAIQVSSRDSRP
jgi:hypothetical protein